MIRVLNWDALLFAWAREQAGQGFAWGETDCGSLVRAALSIMYGRDLFPEVAEYSTLAGAAVCQQETGGVRAQLEALGAVPVPRAFAQQGDVLVDESADGHGFPAAGVVVGRHLLISTASEGVLLAPVNAHPAGSLLRLPNG